MRQGAACLRRPEPPQARQRASPARLRLLKKEDAEQGGKIVVMEPFPGSPAWKADLRRGDSIATVNGHDTTGMDTGAVADLLRGPKGSQVGITVRREGAAAAPAPAPAILPGR